MLQFLLDEIQVRVLGCLVEKDLATPEYYPLTINALVNACNQKSNRDPVMSLQEADIEQALDKLRHSQLAHKSGERGRSVKFCHNLEGLFRLEPAEMAILAELLLRGPQTLGELRTHSMRMHAFDDLREIEDILLGLMERDEPLVERLPRQPGQKDPRYTHILAERGIDPQIKDLKPRESITLESQMSQMTSELEGLRAEVNALRSAFEKFRSEFD